MNVLILGGTRLMGRHLTRTLLEAGHRVTLGNRGQTPDSFGGQVERLTLNRLDGESLSKALSGREYDVICDSLAYSSEDVRLLLDRVCCGRYVTISSAAVYDLRPGLREEDFDPLSYPLRWCSRIYFPYREVKRQAECALFGPFAGQPAAAARFPFVAGEDDYTRRLYFYVEHIVTGVPMAVDNPDSRMEWVRSDEAGRFLAFLAGQTETGPFNGSSGGTVSLREIGEYVRQQTGRVPLYSADGDQAPYNGTPSYSLDTGRAGALGFHFTPLKEWLYPLLDSYIRQARRL
ncbi:MAG: NAD-dependent epimerase/dehydratase family protein [Clostridiales bacterium]|nr:NAD-dependent epimerase/dehydratase family protein [Clostridiales bacterium]